MEIQQRIWTVFAIPALLAACATGAPVDRSFTVRVAPDHSSADGGRFEVTLTNVSDRDICVRNEVLERPDSPALSSALRIGQRSIPHIPEGYLIPQVQGSRVVHPGESLSFKTNLGWRFVRGFESLGRDAEVRIGVSHQPCEPGATVGDLRISWSAWTAIR